MKRSKAWLGITLIVVIAAFIWLGGLYGTVKDIIVAEPAPISPSSLFPRPEDTLYRMDLRLDPVSLELQGHSVITSRNVTAQDLEELWLTTYPNAMRDQAATPAPDSSYYAGFDPGRLQISSARINSLPASCVDLGISCRIDLPEPIKTGEFLKLELEWTGKIPQAAYRYGSKAGVVMLGHFYPVLNVRDDQGWHLSSNTKFGDPFFTQSADYIVKLWVPEAYQVAASGKIVSVEAEDNGWQNMTISAGMVRDFALAAVYNYRKSSVSVDGAEVVGFFNGKRPDTEKEVLERAAAALKYFNRTYGSYGRPQFVVVQAPMKGFQGMEYSGLIFLADDVFAPDYDEQRRAFLVAHETAHQWWYDMVGNNQLEEPWLDEGLANWSAHQYLKSVEYRSIQSGAGNGEANLDQSLAEMNSKEHYMDTAYQAGENFWRQLEEEMGEERVLRVLRAYLAEFKFRTATTEDLRRVITEASRGSLESFFQRWFKAV